MLTVIVLTAGIVGISSADHPPRPGSDNSGLSENETAALWSKAPNECLTDAEYESRYGEARTSMHALGNCTDLTFREPPQSAETWTAYDFESLEPGDRDTSVYPAQAERNQSVLIKDAHASVFAVQPSTKVHLDEQEVTHYLAPSGEIRGFVDYRVHLPDVEDPANESVEYSLIEDEISEVRIKQDGELIERQDGQHKPIFAYELSGVGDSTLTFEADISVELRAEVTEKVGNTTQTRVEQTTDSVTVSQTLDIAVYDLSAFIYYAEYPSGDSGVAIYQTQPWQGYELTADGDAAVRGIWRYYTARDTGWDTLTRSTQTGERVDHSDALPVYVRAYPSEVDPRTEPIRDGPDIKEVWGFESESPASTVHENVDIEVVESSYVRSYGLAVQHDTIDRDSLTVNGIVRGETADIIEPAGGSDREIRKSELSMTIIDQNATQATAQITLRDAETGSPIVLSDSPVDGRFSPIGEETREGYISIDGKQVETDELGIATVTLTEPGSFTAEYHPGSWRTHELSYVGDRDSVSWHPLADERGWLPFAVSTIWFFIPFLVALYAGLKLGSFLHIPEV